MTKKKTKKAKPLCREDYACFTDKEWAEWYDCALIENNYDKSGMKLPCIDCDEKYWNEQKLLRLCRYPKRSPDAYRKKVERPTWYEKAMPNEE